MKYIVECRYEIYLSTGKSWTNWFVYDSTPMDKDKANVVIKDAKSRFSFIDHKTKMKHEYALKEYDTYVTEQNERVKLAEEISKRYKEYLKSDEYKELLRKKRKAAKEHKERQKKYALEHGLE